MRTGSANTANLQATSMRDKLEINFPLRPGYYVELEGCERAYFARRNEAHRDVYHIGPWTYTAAGVPLDDGAPSIVAAWNVNWETVNQTTRRTEKLFNSRGAP